MDDLYEILDLGIPLLIAWGIRSDGKSCRCWRGDRCGKNAGKHPVGVRWQVEGTLWTREELQAGVAAEPGCNFSAATGHAMKDKKVFFVWDIDVDGDKTGAQTMKELAAEGKKMPDTRMTRTGGGGIHIWLAAPPGFEVNNSGGILPGIDIRGLGGQIVIPPSKSWKGEYTYINRSEIADAPQWVIDLLVAKKEDPDWVSVLAGDIPSRNEIDPEDLSRCDDLEAFTIYRVCSELRQMQKLQEGQTLPWARGNSTWGLGTYVRTKDLMRLANSPWSGLTTAMAAQYIRDNAPRSGDFDDSTVDNIIARAAKEVSGIGLDVPPRPTVPKRDWTDLGNGWRFWDHYKNKSLWCDKVGWYSYNGSMWSVQSNEKAQGQIQSMFEEMAREEGRWYSRVPDPDKNGDIEEYQGKTQGPRAEFWKWCEKQHQAKAVIAALKMSQGHTQHHVELSDFDQDGSIVNVKNGILKINGREITPHDPKYLTTMQVPHEFDDKAECPQFEKLVSDMFPDENIRLAVQAMMGYSIFVPENPAKIFPILIGEKDSGKTTLLEIVSDVMPTHATTFELGMLRQKSNDSPTPGLYDVLKARLIFTTEASGEWELHGDFIKRITGNDKIRARPNYARVTTACIPDFTPWCSTNEMPTIIGADDAVKGRLKVAPCARPKGKLDSTLKHRLPKEEGSGILNWLLDGYDLYRNGEMERLMLGLEEATEEAFGETSVFSMFMRDETIPIPGYIELAEHISTAWYAYAEKHHLQDVTTTRLGRELSGLGWKKYPSVVRAATNEEPSRVRLGRRLKTCPQCSLWEYSKSKKNMDVSKGLVTEEFNLEEYLKELMKKLATGGESIDDM